MLKKLLLAASIAALTTGSAQALDITNNGTAIVPALELELPGGAGQEFVFPVNLTLAVDVPASTAFPTSQGLNVVITLPAGVDNDPTMSALTGTLRAGGLDPNLVVTPINLGGNPLIYNVSTTSTTLVALNFTGMMELTSCPTGASVVVMDVTLASTTQPVDGGNATSGNIVEQCDSALSGTVAADATDTAIALSGGFEDINEAGGTPTQGPLTIGDINYTIDTAVGITGTDTDLMATDIASIAFDVDFGADASEVAAVTLALNGVAAPVTSTITGNTAAFIITGGDLGPFTDGTADAIRLTVTGANPIVSQSITVSDAVVTFNNNTADLVPTIPGAEGAIDELQREGQNFGPFDWNDGRAGRTTSVYRVTGFNPGEVVDYTVTLTNSNRDGSFSGTLTADAVGEFTMTSVGFGGVVGTYGRGDVSFNFERVGALDVDRLMVRNGISTSFGGGANSDAEED